MSEIAIQATLFVPAPYGAIAGGPVYNRAMVEGLRDAGHMIGVAELAGDHPLPDDTARAAAAAAWRAMPADAIPVIDGQCLPAFEGIAAELATRGAVGLIHHPTALETGRTDAARDALRETEIRMFRLLRRVVTTSDDTAERLARDFGVAGERIAVVVPGTPPALRSGGPQLAGCNILSIGTLIPRKGHDVLLRALGRLQDLDWSLTIVGGVRDAPYAQSLHVLAGDLEIAERVTFAGEIAPADLEPFWAQAGLFALATHYEGYGMAVAEALRRGLPVAITAGGAQAALVPAAAGVVAPPGAHDELSKAMRRVVFDRGIRRTMADAAWDAGSRLPGWPAQVARFAAALIP